MIAFFANWTDCSNRSKRLYDEWKLRLRILRRVLIANVACCYVWLHIWPPRTREEMIEIGSIVIAVATTAAFFATWPRSWTLRLLFLIALTAPFTIIGVRAAPDPDAVAGVIGASILVPIAFVLFTVSADMVLVRTYERLLRLRKHRQEAGP